MTRVEELIRDYHRSFKKIGNSESWRAILLLYCAVLVCLCTYLLRDYTTGAAHTWCSFGYIAAIVLFLGYCAVMAVLILGRGTVNRRNGEQKLAALLELLDEYRIDWRDRDRVRKLIAEADLAQKRARLDLTILPRLAGLVLVPCLVCVIRRIRSAPVPDFGLNIEILGKAVVVVEILAAVLAALCVFALLEWIAGCLARQYRAQASRYGVFSRQARQLLMFEPDYLEDLLQDAQEAADRRRQRAQHRDEPAIPE